MDSNILSAFIVGIFTVIGAILSRTDYFRHLFRDKKDLSLVGKWESTWKDLDNKDEAHQNELLVINRQKGHKVYGYITMEKLADKKWEFEGYFNGRFLQLLYYPSDEAEDKLFLDNGCYFFERLGDGTFKGYSVGFDYEKNGVAVSKHQLKRIGN